jgi:chorismate mutase
MNIVELRNELNEIDSELLLLLEKRMDLSKKVGVLKKAIQTGVVDVTQKNQKLEQWLLQKGDLREEFVKQLWDMVHDESVFVQQSLL